MIMMYISSSLIKFCLSIAFSIFIFVRFRSIDYLFINLIYFCFVLFDEFFEIQICSPTDLNKLINELVSISKNKEQIMSTKMNNNVNIIPKISISSLFFNIIM